jgi:hypothetical protein
VEQILFTVFLLEHSAFLGPNNYFPCYIFLLFCLFIFVVLFVHLCCFVCLFVLFCLFICVVLFVIRVVLLLIVMFYVLFMWKCVQPPGVNPIAVDKYINITSATDYYNR